MSDDEDYDYESDDSDDREFEDDIMQIEKQPSNVMDLVKTQSVLTSHMRPDQKYTACSKHIKNCLPTHEFIINVKQRLLKISQTQGVSWGKAFSFYSDPKYKIKWNNQKMTQFLNENYNLVEDHGTKMTPEAEQLKKNTICHLCSFGDEPDEQTQLNQQNKVQMNCEHAACFDCYKGYIDYSFNQSGQLCLYKTCIQDGCDQILDYSIYNKVLDQKQQLILDKYILSDILLATANTVSCPNQKCDKIIILDRNVRNSSYNLVCPSCNYAYCTSCNGEPHAPIDCDLYKTWTKQIGGESLNDLNEVWLKLNTKSCPKCSIPIQKNSGCLHMKCTKCAYDFCWICLRPQSEHDNFYQCNFNGGGQQQGQQQQQNISQVRTTFFTEKFLQYKSQVKEFEDIQDKLLTKYSLYLDAISQNKSQNKQFVKSYNDSLQLVREGKMIITYAEVLCYYLGNQSKLVYDYIKNLSNKISLILQICDQEMDEGIKNRIFEDDGNISRQGYEYASKLRLKIEELEQQIYITIKLAKDTYQNRDKYKSQYSNDNFICKKCNIQEQVIEGMCQKCYDQEASTRICIICQKNMPVPGGVGFCAKCIQQQQGAFK